MQQMEAEEVALEHQPERCTCDVRHVVEELRTGEIRRTRVASSTSAFTAVPSDPPRHRQRTSGRSMSRNFRIGSRRISTVIMRPPTNSCSAPRIVIASLYQNGYGALGGWVVLSHATHGRFWPHDKRQRRPFCSALVACLVLPSGDHDEVDDGSQKDSGVPEPWANFVKQDL